MQQNDMNFVSVKREKSRVDYQMEPGIKQIQKMHTMPSFTLVLDGSTSALSSLAAKGKKET